MRDVLRLLRGERRNRELMASCSNMWDVLRRKQEEKRNHEFMASYFKEAVAETLRVVFKDEWNSRYQAKFGSWDDTTGIGSALFHLEKSDQNQIGCLEKFRLGNTNEWDCSVLFEAILSSRVIGKSNLDPSIMINVRKLQSMLNKITHSDAETATLSNHDFQAMLTEVNNSLYALRQPIPSNYTTPMKIQRNKNKSFQVFPTTPQEEVFYDLCKINEKLRELDTLRINGEGTLTYYYISGDRRSGKTQLSQRLCKDLFNRVNLRTETAFVMTLNAKDKDTLLHSYQDFCRRLNCNDNILVSIMNSYQLPEIKIKLLKSLITTRIKTWNKWWIIVDNVVLLDIIHPLLPQMGDENWNNGQIILTVQDEISSKVPADGTFTKHISIGDGTEFRPLFSPRLRRSIMFPRLQRRSLLFDFI